MSVILCSIENFDQIITKDSINLAVPFSTPITESSLIPFPYLVPRTELKNFYLQNKIKNTMVLELVHEMYQNFLASPCAKSGIAAIKYLDTKRKDVIIVCNPDSYFDYTLDLEDALNDNGLFTDNKGGRRL